MFTGIIEEIGIIEKLKKIGNGIEFSIQCKKILPKIKVDDSIAVNGTCLTATMVTGNGFVAQAVDETIRKTNLKNLRIGDEVNLETALTLQKMLGGHLVLGHIDSIGKLVDIRKEDLGTLFRFQYDKQYSKYLVEVGSVAIDGVSLTLAKLDLDTFTVSIIPHTKQNTIFRNYTLGQEVNLEFDIIGKYVERIINQKEQKQNNLQEIIEKFW